MGNYEQQIGDLVAPGFAGTAAEIAAFTAGFSACQDLAVVVGQAADVATARGVKNHGIYRRSSKELDKASNDSVLLARLKADTPEADQSINGLLRDIHTSDLGSSEKQSLYQRIADLLDVSISAIQQRVANL